LEAAALTNNAAHQNSDRLDTLAEPKSNPLTGWRLIKRFLRLGEQVSAPVSEPRFIVQGTILSHPGLVREANEDSVIFSIPAGGGAGHAALIAVADGMGGHAAGEVASRIAIETISRLYTEAKGPIPARLKICFTAANRAIIERGEADPACAGMGTTCTAIVMDDDKAWLAHVGDSRAYLLRSDQFHLISQDHTLVGELVKKGILTRDEALLSPDRNIIVRAMGSDRKIDPLIWREGLPLLAGDRLVVCSDGLTDLVADETIQSTITSMSPAEACQTLIDAALAAGGHDNISVGVFLITPPPPSSPDPGLHPTRPIPLSQQPD
jgi:serine/threonine protein phosphatase PrpC